MIASWLRFPWLDRVVGLLIAVVILKSAVDLIVEVVRARGEGEIDLSRYRFGPAEQYARLRRRQFRDWLLLFVDERAPIARDELIERVTETLDFRRMPTLRELGVADAHAVTAERVREEIDALDRDGLVFGETGISVTDEGRRLIRRRLRGPLA